MQDTVMATAPEIDISRMDYAQLSALRERIEERVREMRETEGPALRERVMQQAAAIGMTIEELIQLGSKRRGRPTKKKNEHSDASHRKVEAAGRGPADLGWTCRREAMH